MNTDEIDQQLESEGEVAAAAITAAVRQLLDADLHPSAIVPSLADALGQLMAAAPRDMADRMESAIVSRIKRARAATWATIDAAPAPN